MTLSVRPAAWRVPHNAASQPPARPPAFLPIPLLLPGGFEDDMDFALRPRLLGCVEQLEDAGVALGIIGDIVRSSAEAELESCLGNVNASAEDGEVILTHACKCEPRAVHPRALIQRFEFGMTHADVACCRTHPALTGAHARGARGSSASPPHWLQPVRRPRLSAAL